MTKFLKITSIVFLSFLAMLSVLTATYMIITKDAKLDPNKLIGTRQNIIIYDKNGEQITETSIANKKSNVNVENLEKHTINAFIASEDRTFYRHNGLNYRRMLKAFYKNVTSASFKEGASTISQQLIKNTHLSNDKTIKRKLNEIKLTKRLEKLYPKDEILEMYLNTIYFGHNCYGLQSAAQFYFDKRAEELTLTESAVLVGLLSSPNNYSPLKNPEKSLKRRNLVLKAMAECQFISRDEYETAINTPLECNPNKPAGKNADYVNALWNEMEEQQIDFYGLKNGSKIYTYLDTNLQNEINDIDYDCDNSVIVTTSDGKVSAFKSTINGAKRQPGSTIKPLLVYAPAIDEKLLNPCTKVLDEKINFNGYSPENFDKKFRGYVSVTDCVKSSLNVPAVKTLNNLTIPRAEKYLNAMGICLEEDEKNLAIALGGMKHGLSLKELTDRYSIFSNKGDYSPSRFINKIVAANGEIIYENRKSANKVFSEGCCSLTNEMLIETAKTGTAKRLKDFKFDVAAKTGTCGNYEGNTDAYTVCYTSEHCIGVWLGDGDNKRLDVTGGGHCCNIAKNLLENLYFSHNPAKLDTTSGTVTVNLDLEEYQNNNKIILADEYSPKLNLLQAKTLSDNIPKEKSTRFHNPCINQPRIKVENNEVKIELCQTKYYSYVINRYKNGQKCTVYDGVWKNFIFDKPDDGTYIYTVTPYYKTENNVFRGIEIELPAVGIKSGNRSEDVKIPDIAKKDWFNL